MVRVGLTLGRDVLSSLPVLMSVLFSATQSPNTITTEMAVFEMPRNSSQVHAVCNGESGKEKRHHFLAALMSDLFLINSVDEYCTKFQQTDSN